MRTAACHLLALCLFSFQLTTCLPAQTNTAAGSPKTNTLTVIKNTVEVARADTEIWRPGKLNQSLGPGDRVRTGERSFAQVYLAVGMTKDLSELSELEVPPAPGVTFKKGLFKIFNREKTKTSQFNLQGATAAIRGTDFLVRVADNGVTELTVLDGEVLVTNAAGELALTNGQRGIVAPGVAPHRTAVVEAVNDLIQWSLYYPAVLDADELAFSREERQALSASLASYRAGDLLAAVGQYPWEREPASEAERSFRAALLLAVGRVDEVQSLLKNLTADSSASSALKEVIAAVKFQSWESGRPPASPAEWLAESYYEQSRAQLPEALAAARAAAQQSPQFGFAWARVAELEFSFGRTAKALEALERSLQLSPSNAQAIALNGFLLAAQDKIAAAISKFDQAITIDSGLGNAWLGRGLCRIRQGRSEAGLRDLMVAASLESQRSILRSYLGKAFADTGKEQRALKEWALAKELDSKDPTGWLYSALFNQEQHRFNEGISDLEKSLDLTDNRRVYRSRFLLDQDRAVRSSSLASIYRDDGLTDVAVREAAASVAYDYANYSAHLFLANSFDALRDPTRFNLRYETVWFNELLLANLLAPVGAGVFAQNISQQEYSRLFDVKRFGLTTTTEVRGDGQYREIASQFGNFGNFGYALDLDYQHNDGVRPNNELDRIEWYSQFKFQLTPADTLFLLTKYQDYHSGDNFQYYEPTNASPYFKFDEYQSPIALAGFHREWQPGIHTLVLAGRLENDQRFSDRDAQFDVVHIDAQMNPPPPVRIVTPVRLDVEHRSQLEIYTAELQQIFESEHHALLFGARWQGGEFDTSERLANFDFTPASYSNYLGMSAADLSVNSDFNRVTAYGYETLKLPGNLRLTGGLAYEHMRFPKNFRAPPISEGEETRDRFNPKAALVWDIVPQATLRAVYARSLGGVSLDESYRLEPAQLAGFSQAFRTLISESLVGSVAAPDHEVAGAALDLKFKTGTYVGLAGQILNSRVRQTIGVFDYVFYPDDSREIVPSSTPNNLDYEETSATVTFNQLVSKEWSLGAQYSFVRSELESKYPALSQVRPSLDSINRADLHRFNLFLLYNHPSGFFARAESLWYWQQNFASAANLAGDSFQQLNLFVGYRLPRQRGDLTLGVLNATGENYKLNPVTPYEELPREAVFFVRLRLRF